MNALLAAFLGGWEIVLILAIILLLLSARYLPGFARRLGEGMGKAGGFKRAVQGILDALGRDPKFHQPDCRGEVRPPEEVGRFSMALFVAQGFGIGRIPFAPGTFGSLAGLLWFALLVSTGNYWAYVAGAIEGIALSIWLCDEGEKILRQQDPGCIVLDEIIAIPFCFLPWVTSEWLRHDRTMPALESFIDGGAWKWALLTVVLFRVFDIVKPWPIHRLQGLPGGWGVTADDLLAAVYVALLSLPFIN